MTDSELLEWIYSDLDDIIDATERNDDNGRCNELPKND